MSKTYKMVTVVGTSPDSSDDAIRNAVSDAAGSLRNLGWFEVKELRGRVSGDSVAEFQVKLEIGLLVESD